MATVPLVNLLDALLQKAYHDLNVLQELLRNKSDGDRKVEIVKYAQRTRALLIRLLALVKWAGNSSSVQQCSEMSAMLSQQSGLYVNTADQLVELVRSILVNACAPNFSLAPALDVLGTGSYPRLPTCIKDKVVPLPPLTSDEQTQAFSLITCAIRARLLKESIPADMTVSSIGGGVICFKVPHEFEMTLSVLSDSPAVPWRLISLRVLVGEALPHRPVLLHPHQRLYLHQLVQSRLYSEERPLRDCYECLHGFCLALQLDCLHSQACQLSNEVCGGYVKVEEYVHAHHLKIVYWRPGSSHLMSAFLLEQSRNAQWPKILISFDPSQTGTPFSTQHFPPLPSGAEVKVDTHRLSMEAILKQCVQVRSHALLRTIKEGLRESAWDERAELQDEPLSLRVRVPLKYATRWAVLGVDPRVGNVVATMEPPCEVEGVASCLQELEKGVTAASGSLEGHLNRLQCHLFVAHVFEVAKQLNLPTHWSLPLVNPLPFHAQSQLFLELRPQTHLVVSVGEGLLDQYHLLSLTSTSLLGSPSQSADGASPPKIFFTASSLVELNPEEISLQHLKTVRVRRSGPLLKRKMRESNLTFPSLKRLCLRGEPDFAPLPSLVLARMVLLSMESSLNSAGISHHTAYTEHGTPTANIFSFPRGIEGSLAMHKRLSSFLQSCTVTHTPSTYSCTFVFSPLDLGGQSGGQNRSVILRQSVPVSDQKGSGQDLGRTLVGMWEARVSLLGMTLELRQYLENIHWPLHSQCSISEFTYDQLTITFGAHQLNVTATPTGLSLSFSPDCPHVLVRDSLEAFLRSTCSLSLLLQGVCSTQEVMGSLAEFSGRIAAVGVSAASPSRLQLNYDQIFSLSLHLQANASVIFTDMRYMKVSQQMSPVSYLQAFLHSVFSTNGSSESEDTADKAPPSVPSSHKPTLYPIPSPISFPRRASFPDSVPSPHGGFNIPSIPAYPSPAMGHAPLSQGGSWSCPLSLEQFKQLLSATPSHPVRPDSCVEGYSLLGSFLGCMGLLFHSLQQVAKHQMALVQCDRGAYTYRSDNISVTMTMDLALLRVTLKPVKDNVWSPSEMESLMELFKKEVVKPPFTVFEVQSFYSLLNLPLALLKSCVQLINHQLKPPTGLTWNFSLCLTIPPSADIAYAPFTKGGAAVIYGRGKLLLFLRLERVQDQKSFVLPLMFDPKTNMTYIARFQNQHRNPVHNVADNILKKASTEATSSQLPGHHTLSLFPAVLTLAQTQNLPV